MKQINLSPSFLIKVLDKGYDYAVAEKLGLIKKETALMSKGKLVHSFISEQFGGKVEKIAISPYDNFRTKEAQNWRHSQPDDTLIIKEHEYEFYKNLSQRVKNHPEVQKLIKGKTVVAEEKIELKAHGETIKGFIDLLAVDDEQRIVIDWKYVSSAVFDDFARKALWSNYDLQAASYDILANATHIYFVAIENEAPHRIKVFFATPGMLESGASKFEKAVQIIKKENWRKPTFDIMGVEDIREWGY